MCFILNNNYLGRYVFSWTALVGSWLKKIEDVHLYIDFAHLARVTTASFLSKNVKCFFSKWFLVAGVGTATFTNVGTSYGYVCLSRKQLTYVNIIWINGINTVRRCA